MSYCFADIPTHIEGKVIHLKSGKTYKTNKKIESLIGYYNTGKSMYTVVLGENCKSKNKCEKDSRVLSVYRTNVKSDGSLFKTFAYPGLRKVKGDKISGYYQAFIGNCSSHGPGLTYQGLMGTKGNLKPYAGIVKFNDQEPSYTDISGKLKNEEIKDMVASGFCREIPGLTFQTK